MSRFAAALVWLALLACPALAGPIPSYPLAVPPIPADATVVGNSGGLAPHTAQFNVSSLAPAAYLYTQIPSVSITATTIVLGGYRTLGDLATGDVYTSNGCTSAGLHAEADATGRYYCLVLNGAARPGSFGAYGDAQYAFFNGAITTGPCVLTVSGITGVIRPGDALIGDSVPAGNPTITAQLTGSTGLGGTYSLSTCAAAASAPAFTGTIAGFALTISGLTGGPLKVNQPIFGAGVAANTEIASVIDATDYTVNVSQAVGPEAMTGKLNMQTYGGHDDAAAIKAAAATGSDVLIAGPPPTNASQVNYFAMLSGVTLTAKRQKFIMRSARLLALPGFTDGFMVTASGSRQEYDRLMLDGGAVIGVTNVGGFRCDAGTTDVVLKNRDILHYSTIGVDIESSCRLEDGGITQQWNNFEPWFYIQSNYTAIGHYYNHADSQEQGGYANWNHTNYYFDCNARTEMIGRVHPYNGDPGPPIAVDPEETHVAGCLSGAVTFVQVYSDNGQWNVFAPQVSLRDFWPLQLTTVSSFTNNCLINYYANGSTGQMSNADYRLFMQNGLNGSLALLCVKPNPNALTVTGATGDGAHVTLTLAPSAAVNVASVKADGVHVRYRVAWWPAGHPLLGDTVTIAGFGTGGYNVANAVVTDVGPLYVTVANATTGATGALGTVRPDSAWTSDNPMPSFAGGTLGKITVTGMNPSGYNTTALAPATVTNATATTVSYASSFNTAFVSGGSMVEDWTGDWGGIAALQPALLPRAIENGGRLVACGQTNTACIAYYAPSADVTGGIGFTFQIGAAAGPFTFSPTNTGLNMGAPSGSSTYCFGLEVSPAPGCLVENGASGLTVRQSNINRWIFDSSGPFKPGTDGLTFTTASVGTASLGLANLFSHKISLGQKLTFDDATPAVAGNVGTSPTIAGNGTDPIVITVGTGPAGTTETITFANAASTGWVCTSNDQTTGGHTIRQTGGTNNTAVMTWDSAPTAADKVTHQCAAY